MSEQTVLLTRVLPAYAGAPDAALEVQEKIIQLIPVNVGFSAEGWFCIRFPALLPKKAAGSAEYVRSFLYPAMQKMCIRDSIWNAPFILLIIRLFPVRLVWI